MSGKASRSLLMCLALFAAACGIASAGQVQYISIATSSSGGAFAVIGTAMSDIINKNVPGVRANIEVTGGSSENIILVGDKNVEFGMSASDVLNLAINGKGSFEGKKVGHIKGVMGGHLTTMQVYVLADSPIKSCNDLKGKKISVGPAGSVASDAMRALLLSYGYEINADWTPEYLSHGDGAEALTDGNVDAVCIMSTVPCSPIASAAASKPVRLLNIDAKNLEKILASNIYVKADGVPANTYKGQTEAVTNTFGSASLMICHESMPEDMVYNVLKALYENNAALVKAYPQCKEWNIDNAYRGLEGNVEMHPGAIKYLKEAGKAK